MIILVVGMHRSGTSLVARGLHAMGANLGERIDTEPHPANPHGHWEHTDVWQAQERLLIRFGREWHSSPGPLPHRWMEWPDTTATIARLTAVATAEIEQHGHWVVKDPRSSLLIPLWREVAHRAGSRLRIVRIFRADDEVAASLEARNGMPREFAVRIWADHQRSIDRDAMGMECKTFRHDAIMCEPLAAFTEMGAWCGLSDASSRAVSAAALVDPTLWHHLERADCDGGTAVVPADPATPADLGHVLVVMRTRWRHDMLPRAIRSVLSQTYPHWFLQIVNDGGPVHLVEAEVGPYRNLLQERLGILHRDRQYGMEAATNAGIAAGQSEFIAIHDDDDTWSPEFLERMVQRLDTTGRGAAVSHSRIVREAWDGSDYVRQGVVEFGPTLDQITAADLASHNHFPPISFLFRRRVYEEVGSFHEGLPALGDWHFNKRVAAREPIDVHPDALCSWHHRAPSSDTPNSPRIDHWRAMEFVTAWPATAPLPEFFSQMRQVRMLGNRAGFTASDPDRPVLAAGLYLIRFPFVGAASSDAQENGSFHVRIGTTFATRRSIPLVARPGEPATVLLNAPQPVGGLGLDSGSGTVEPLPATAEIVRLGDPLGQLDDFAGPPRLPDVLCIGAQRSGTTWLHGALQAIPQVWACGIKEFHHFDWDGIDPTIGEFRQRQALALLAAHADGATADVDREQTVRMALRQAFPPVHSWENYAALFAAAPPDRLACDFTPSYATLGENDVANIVRMMPNIKVIFLLRDPVARALSGGLHQLHWAGVERPTERQLHEACAASANVLRTDYLRTLDIWQRHLPEGQLLVLFHDDIALDPAGVVARTCAFLGIETPASSGGAWGAHIPRNAGLSSLAWPERARVKAELSRRWLPMLCELEHRCGEPVRQWRLAAEARLLAAATAQAGGGAGLDNTVANNLAQWDHCDPWLKDGDEWDGQSRKCGVAYADWKAGVMDRYLPLFRPDGVVVEIGPGHGRWSELLIQQAGLLVLCDVSPNCLDACRQRLAGRGRLRTHLSQAADLPADLTGAVDAVWSYDCLVHVGREECARYFAEIGRVLRAGGVAVLHHADRRTGLAERIAKRLRQWWRRGYGVAADHGWRSPVSSADIRRWAEEAGLMVERQESMWTRDSPRGRRRIGVPRFGDCITVLRR